VTVSLELTGILFSGNRKWRRVKGSEENGREGLAVNMEAKTVYGRKEGMIREKEAHDTRRTKQTSRAKKGSRRDSRWQGHGWPGERTERWKPSKPSTEPADDFYLKGGGEGVEKNKGRN